MDWYLFIGICVVFLVVAIIFLIVTKRRCKRKYDERQKAIQGVAYKVGFFTMFAYFLINGFICTEIGNWLPVIEMNFIGIGVGVICYAGYAIFNDAYISLNIKPFNYLMYFSIFAVEGYISFFLNVTKGETPELYLTILICAILLTVIFVMLIIKVIIDKVSAKKELVEK